MIHCKTQKMNCKSQMIYRKMQKMNCKLQMIHPKMQKMSCQRQMLYQTTKDKFLHAQKMKHHGALYVMVFIFIIQIAVPL